MIYLDASVMLAELLAEDRAPLRGSETFTLRRRGEAIIESDERTIGRRTGPFDCSSELHRISGAQRV